jgi:hypothetical protein
VSEAAGYDDLYSRARREGARARDALLARHAWLQSDVHAWPVGWAVLVERLCGDIAKVLVETPLPGFRVDVIREKFGGLNVQWLPWPRPPDDQSVAGRRIAELVAAAVTQSLATCEICGRPGTERWLEGLPDREAATLCDEHAALTERA